MGEALHQLKCEHCFHSECIVPWLKTSNSCPGCRGEAYTPTCERPDYSEMVERLEMLLNGDDEEDDDDDYDDEDYDDDEEDYDDDEDDYYDEEYYDDEEEDYYEEEEVEEEQEQLEDGSIIVGRTSSGVIFAARPI